MSDHLIKSLWFYQLIPDIGNRAAHNFIHTCCLCVVFGVCYNPKWIRSKFLWWLAVSCHSLKKRQHSHKTQKSHQKFLEINIWLSIHARASAGCRLPGTFYIPNSCVSCVQCVLCVGFCELPFGSFTDVYGFRELLVPLSLCVALRVKLCVKVCD